MPISPAALATVEPARPLSRWAPLIMGSALFMQGLDGTAITVALPSMAASLHTQPLRLNMAISAYLLGIAVFIPASAWIADRSGARRTFCAAIGLFAIASFLCGIAPDLTILVLARILQGIGGAMMIPVGRLVLLRSVPRHDLVRAIALFTTPALIGPVLGAPLGGLIVELSSWHWIFFINLPVGAIGIWATLRHIPDLRSPHPGPFDLRGFLMLGTGLSGVTFALSALGGSLPLDVVATFLAAGLLGLGLYLHHARRTTRPVLNHRLLWGRSFRTAILSGCLWRAAVAGIPILTALQLQLGFGLDPLAAGMLVFTSAAGALLMKAAAEPVLRRFGFRRVLIGNVIVTALFTASYGLFNASTPHLLIILGLFAGGFFRSLQYTSLGALTYADLTDEAMSGASAFASMAQEIAQSIGTSVAVLLVHSVMLVSGATQPGMTEIRFAFPIMALIALVALPGFLRLRDEDGAAVHGATRPA